MLIHKTQAALVLNKPPGLATQGGTGTFNHVDGLLDAYHEDDEPRPRLVHRLDKDTSGVLLVARTPGSAAFFSKRFSGRSAKKIYWALVVGVPDVDEGTIDAPLAKQPGTGGEKMHVNEESGQPATDPLPRGRPRRQPRRLGRAAAAHRPHPPAARPHGGDRPPDRGRRQVRRAGRVPDRFDQPQDAPARPPPDHRRAQGQQGGGGTLDVTAELPEHFAASMEQLGFDRSTPARPSPRKARPRPRARKKQKAKAHAKTYRKARRGERRTRTLGAPRSKPKGGKR